MLFDHLQAGKEASKSHGERLHLLEGAPIQEAGTLTMAQANENTRYCPLRRPV